MAAIKALQQWCKIQCDGYRDVNVTNMTTSFRDGLAFCALIHRHRPDLIDFDSLNKENVFENNSLAFQVAEEHLGIPALLDAEDMVALKVPDRLSILTYVSQYYNYFHGRSPIGGMGGIKRPAEESKEEPSEKKNQTVVAKPFTSKPTTENQPPSTTKVSVPPPARHSPKLPSVSDQKKILTETSNKTGTLSSTCEICKNHVHLVQRHLVDGKLYHRSCFKCAECSTTLLSGTCTAGTKPGTFVCTTHQSTKSSQKTIPSPGGVFHKHDPKADPGNNLSLVKNAASHSVRPMSGSHPGPVNAAPGSSPWTTSAAKTQAARQRFFQGTPSAQGLQPGASFPAVPREDGNSDQMPSSAEKDRARLLISDRLNKLNCNNNNTVTVVGFGKVNSHSGNGSILVGASSWRGGKSSDSERLVEPKNSNREHPKPYSLASASKGFDGSESKPSGWRATLKPLSNPSEKPSAGFTEAPEKTGPSSPSPGDAVNVRPPQPVIRPTGTSAHQSAVPSRQGRSSPKMPRRDPAGLGLKAMSGSLSPYSLKPEMESPKGKSSHVSKEEIQRELAEIEDSLSDLEKKGVELEQSIRRCEEEGKDDDWDALMVDWFTLINEKQSHLRRESELVYIAKTQDLEEQQPEVEVQLRRLMNKPEYLKTSADRRREEELMARLLEIVDDRNAIVEGLDEDRLREKDEDEQLNKMMQQLGSKKTKKKRKSLVKMLFK